MAITCDPTAADCQRRRQNFVRNTKTKAAQREQLLSAQPAAHTELRDLCCVLHRLAQKYVPNTAQCFIDFDTLTHATKALRRLGAAAPLAAHVVAPEGSIDKAVVINSPEYRALRNKFIAALATIADLTAKNTPPGTPDYQRGVREGYRRASDVAILFLEDMHPERP